MYIFRWSEKAKGQERRFVWGDTFRWKILSLPIKDKLWLHCLFIILRKFQCQKEYLILSRLVYLFYKLEPLALFLYILKRKLKTKIY